MHVQIYTKVEQIHHSYHIQLLDILIISSAFSQHLFCLCYEVYILGRLEQNCICYIKYYILVSITFQGTHYKGMHKAPVLFWSHNAALKL